MLIKKKVTNTKKTALLVLLVVSMTLTVYMLYSSSSTNISVIHRDTSGVIKLNTIQINTNIDSSYFSQSPYKDLTQYGSLPVQVETLGRSNPFSELPFYVQDISDEE